MLAFDIAKKLISIYHLLVYNNHIQQMMVAFEPMTAAVLACTLLESCPRSCSRRLSVPRARVWLRRNADTMLDNLLEDGIAEPLLDLTNVVDPQILAASILLLLLWHLCVVVFATAAAKASAAASAFASASPAEAQPSSDELTDKQESH